MKSLGDLLRQSRGQRRLNQRELAEILQICRERIQAWERDETVPTVEELAQLSVALNLPATVGEALPNSGL